MRAELTAVELPTLRPLLDEIGAEEAAAKRLSPVLLVQERAVDDPEIRTDLDAVHRYWEELPSVDGAALR